MTRFYIKSSSKGMYCGFDRDNCNHIFKEHTRHVHLFATQQLAVSYINVMSETTPLPNDIEIKEIIID